MVRCALNVAGGAAALSAFCVAAVYGSSAVNATATGAVPMTLLETLDELNSLNFLLPYWQYMLDNYDEFTINAGLTFVLHEIVYFGGWIPYLLLDYVPWVQKYKIQDKPNTWAMTAKCLKLLAFNHVIVQLPMMISSHSSLTMLGFGMEAPLPTAWTIFWKVMVSAVLEDFYNYWAHRFLHWKKIYKYIHKLHHEYAAPFGITAEYAHPAETLILGLGTFLGPLLLTRHLLTLWVWMVVRIMQSIDSHSGYDLPFALTSWLPFWGGPVHHDYHHEKFDCNYASFFTIWDWVFGTDVQFREAQHIKYMTGKSSWSDAFYKLGLASYVKKDTDAKKAKTA
ncbi:hypothetical protein SDRG_03234 [Saprolegnia diclina VS20]|uniref:Fatty acid hydroxylase domain-containing protein n=1 Tax=Saprolegnia diclina (strain VS20) TaxID=1156394 RepID=T0SAH2_SAPDV|nr:hypothetical protein SDRG_03234 [Saprolegnia diclina VS20]EQC39812.1 hypothetical protein SDRG_03234 [Saprolegnia diclina VS20]|eukprot:XP_008607084.1 hypothetical protein SDRG_03234 [Saprolegnia diclina VS20]